MRYIEHLELVAGFQMILLRQGIGHDKLRDLAVANFLGRVR